MIRFILVQIAIGAMLATLLLAGVLSVSSAGVQAILAEAASRPGQMLAMWLGGVAPFAIGYLATALYLVGDASGGGSPVPPRHRPSHHPSPIRIRTR